MLLREPECGVLWEFQLQELQYSQAHEACKGIVVGEKEFSPGVESELLSWSDISPVVLVTR